MHIISYRRKTSIHFQLSGVDLAGFLFIICKGELAEGRTLQSAGSLCNFQVGEKYDRTSYLNIYI